MILGAGGLVGRAMTAVFSESVKAVSPHSSELDVRDAQKIMKQVCSLKPRLVINCTGYSGHDVCEKYPARAWEINATAVRHIAHACALAEATMVQISSAAVFDGVKEEPYTEEDVPAPLNIYGASKLAGEAIVRTVAPASYVFRLPMLYGEPKKDTTSFIARLRSRLVDASTKEVRLADDEQASPTSAETAAHAIRQTIEQQPPGLYHLACSGTTSLYELGVFMAKALHSRTTILSVPAATFNRTALKPRQGCLASCRVDDLGDWQIVLTQWLIKCHLPAGT